VQLSTLIERRSQDATAVLAEREMRRFERDGEQFSIDLDRTGPRRDQRHWPDLAPLAGRRRTALELEFTPKGTQLLASIVEAYTLSSYDEVRYVVTEPALARRIASLATTTTAPLHAGTTTRIVVVPWITVDGDVAAAVKVASQRD
jgi:hypothetical protein